MSRARESDIAAIGYKIRKGDYIELVTPFGMTTRTKTFRVSSVTEAEAIVDLPDRNAMRFPRLYLLPFLPIEKKTKPDYVSPNTWRVRMNDRIHNQRLRFD